MKEFFEQCLRDLHKLTGLKQYLEICNKSTEQEAREEMAIIVNGMVMVSEKFSYIPQDAQKRIVRHQIVSDHEMYALNAKVVYKWFNQASDKYWHESGHLETNDLLNSEHDINPISEETQKMINEYLAKLASGTIREVPKVSDQEIKKIETEDTHRQSRPSYSKGYKLPTEEEVLRKELHFQWLKENFHPITREKLPTFADEREWLLNKGYFIDGNGEIQPI